MKKIFFVAILIFVCFVSFADEHDFLADSSGRSALRKALYSELDAISATPFSSQMEGVDRIINFTEDSVMRRFLAVSMYDYYLNSKIMGAESVAVHIIDKWFASGKIKMYNDVDLLNAMVYADFNRNSLLGMRAPEIFLRNLENVQEKIPSDKSYSVIYFYSPDCQSCILQTPLLCKVLEKVDSDIDFYAVNTSDNDELHKKYAKENFVVDNPKVKIHHLGDPFFETDYRKDYGVLKTPKLFLTDKNKKIIGRNLDAVSLKKLLMSIGNVYEYVYGTEQSSAFYEKILPETISETERNSFLHTFSRIIKEKKDTSLFRNMVGDLLHYMLGKRDESSMLTTMDIIDSLITPYRYVWRKESDSLQVLCVADMAKEIDAMLPTGSFLPEIKVSAIERRMNKKGKIKEKKHASLSLSKIKKECFLIFYSPSCSNCSGLPGKADSLLKKGCSLFLINVSEEEKKGKSRMDDLLRHFDLSSLPYSVYTDEKGIVRRKYISF